MPADVLDLNRRGIMLVLSSPSGAGKSSISRALIDEERENLFLSISVTTRVAPPQRGRGRSLFFRRCFPLCPDARWRRTA